MPTAPINGIDLYYEDSDPSGSAELPALVFLHGAMGNTVGWWQQVPVFKSTHRCITYDIRGYGRSPDPTKEAMTFLISDLEGLIDHLGLTKVSFVAQSMGGRAALGYCTRHAERVHALVLADNWGGFDWPEQDLRAQEHKPVIPEGHPRGVGLAFPTDRPALCFLWQQIGALNPQPRPKLEGPTPGGPTIQEVKNLEVPILCLVGVEDFVFPPPLIKAFSEILKNAEYVEVPGAGHSVYFEKPEEFNKHVSDFLFKHGCGKAAVS